MLTIFANELAFDGAGSHSIAAGSRSLQMTAHIGKPGRQHALANLGCAFRIELVVKHRTDLGRLGVELLGHVLEPVAVMCPRRLQVVELARPHRLHQFRCNRLLARLISRFKGPRQVQLDL